MVFAVIDGVLKLLVAVASKVPAVAAEYQFIVVPETKAALNKTLPEPHRDPAVVTGAVGAVFVMLSVFVIVVPLQPLTITVTVPVVNAIV